VKSESETFASLNFKMRRVLALRLFRERFVIARFAPGAVVALDELPGRVVSVTRTDDETSVICGEGPLPAAQHVDEGWRCLAVRGPFAFQETGILAALTKCLAEAAIGVMAICTFDTDYLFVKEDELASAVEALRRGGHQVE
jgi:hypothetical protein